jgi:hypothetical protein
MNPACQGPKHDKQRYMKLTANGASVICETFEVADIVEDETEYTVTEVWMSPTEYLALPEFQGF